MKIIKKNYFKHKETIHNFFWRSLQIFGKQGITFLVFIICAKLLVPYEFGIYNYVLATIFFLIMFGDFGISTATSKYVAEYNATDKEKLKSVLFNSGVIILGLTIIITILTLIIGPLYLKDKYIYVLYLLPLMFLTPMTSLYDGIYRGLKKFKQLAILSLIVGFISLSFVYFLIRSYGLIGALIAQNLFYLLLLLALAFGYREFNFKWNIKTIREIGKYSLIVGTASLGYIFLTKINVLILGYFNYVIEIGLYEINNKIMLMLLLPFTILCQIISPNITNMHCSNKTKEINIKIKKYLLLSFGIGIIISILIYLIIPIFINYFLKEYAHTELVWIIRIFLIILPFNLTSHVLANGFSISTGHASINTKMLLIFGIINISTLPLILLYFKFIGFVYFIALLQILTNISFITYYLIKLSKESNGKVL